MAYYKLETGTYNESTKERTKIMKENLRIIDVNSGEDRGEYKIKKYQKNNHHTYYLIFADNLASSKANMTSTMHIILLSMDFNNRIKFERQQIIKLANKYSVKFGTIGSTFAKMVKDGLLIREHKGYYFANPYYFTKANLNRVNNLRIEWGKIRDGQYRLNIQQTLAIEKRIIRQARDLIRGGDDD